MPIVATQPISSPFGSYLPGDHIDVAAAGPVMEAWLAAGIVADEKPVKAAGKSVERATKPKPEKAVGRRQADQPRRFASATDKPAPHRRFQEETS